MTTVRNIKPTSLQDGPLDCGLVKDKILSIFPFFSLEVYLRNLRI